jgi:hypothetical protein
LTVLSRAGKLADPRTRDALDIVEGKRGPDGSWQAEGYYWHLDGERHVMGQYWSAAKKTWKKRTVSSVEVVDWCGQGSNKMITLNALRVLKAAGRIK